MTASAGGMSLGIGLGLTFLRSGGAAIALGDPRTYTPFLGYSARLETVVADTTVMAQLTDQSGNGRHATQATAGSRAAYRTNDTNGLPAFEFDGSADCYATANLDLSLTSAVTVVAVAKPTTSAAFRNLCELSATYAGITTGFMVAHESDNIPSANILGNVGNISHKHDLAWNGAAHAFFAVMDKTRSREEVSVYLDGMLMTTAFSSTNNTNAYAAAEPLHVASRAGTSRFWLGRFHELWLYDRALTDQELGDLSLFFGTTYALTHGVYTAIDPATNLADNRIITGHYSPLHRFVFDTTATRIAVVGVTDQYAASPSQGSNAEIGVRVANADVTTFSNVIAGSLLTRHAIKTLAGGSKRVELVSNAPGMSPAVTGTVYGAHLTGVWVPSDATTTYVVPDDADRIVVYGDSIAIGDKATNAVLDGWAAIVRANFFADAAFAGNLRVEAYGNRTLYEDANTSGLRATFVPTLTADSPTIIVISIGTNDYGFGRPPVLPTAWTATAFGTALAAVFDAINAALPGCEVYAISPIGRLNEATLVNGENLAAYRTATSNACSGRAWVTYVNGLTILDYNGGESAEYNADGVHPDSGGYVIMAGRIKTALGIV